MYWTGKWQSENVITVVYIFRNGYTIVQTINKMSQKKNDCAKIIIDNTFPIFTFPCYTLPIFTFLRIIRYPAITFFSKQICCWKIFSRARPVNKRASCCRYRIHCRRELIVNIKTIISIDLHTHDIYVCILHYGSCSNALSRLLNPYVLQYIRTQPRSHVYL